MYNLSDYYYELPPEQIAKFPVEPRDHSRLMIVERKNGLISEIPFFELKNLLKNGDSLILNDTQVFPSRLVGKKETGGHAEILLLRPVHDFVWEVLAKPGRRLQKGAKIHFAEDFACEVVDTLPGGEKRVKFHFHGDFAALVDRYGKLPIPPYMQREAEETDAENYQTVYAKKRGAIAAPTAGLHFTKELLASLQGKGVDIQMLTLHVGMGTFKPVSSEDIRGHRMHEEHVMISEEAARGITAGKKGGRQICVGTTCCRALESAMQRFGKIQPAQFTTDIFIYPGYEFRYVEALLTNFHLPGSSLLMLVSAFAGHDLMKQAYRRAIKEQFRFYSYGDAMLII